MALEITADLTMPLGPYTPPPSRLPVLRFAHTVQIKAARVYEEDVAFVQKHNDEVAKTT